MRSAVAFTKAHVTERSLKTDVLTSLRRSSTISIAFGLVLAFAVVAPMTGKGWTLLLDWTPGPAPSMPRGIWGLGTGITGGLPFYLVRRPIELLLGEATTGWLLIGLLFPLGMWSVSRLMSGPLLATAGAGTLYLCNPIVFERLWAGQIVFLFGYALLPAFAASLLRAKSAVTTSLWMFVLVSCSIHFIWIAGVLILAWVVMERPSADRAIRLGLMLVMIALSNSYLAPSAGGTSAEGAVTDAHLNAFATRTHHGLGLVGTLLSLYGFWRNEPRLPIDVNPGWPFFAAAIVVLIVAGLTNVVRTRNSERSVAVALLIAGFVGLLLAAGARGPLTGPFTWVFNNVPGFAIMREPQKFISLLALLYAYGFGKGLGVLGERMNATFDVRKMTAIGLVGILLPVAFTPTLLWGLAGRIHPSAYPDSWSAAASAIPKSSQLLFLPWHEYLSFPFTDQRRIANPADNFFPQHVITGDDPELPGVSGPGPGTRSAYLSNALANGGSTSNFGKQMKPIGVEYIVVSKVVDWKKYSWLDYQSDLSKTIDTEDLVVFHNNAYRGRAYTGDTPAIAVEKSPTLWSIRPSGNGDLTFTEPFILQWSANGKQPQKNAAGTMNVDSADSVLKFVFTRWPRIRAFHALSLAGVLFMATLCIRRKISARGSNSPASFCDRS